MIKTIEQFKSSVKLCPRWAWCNVESLLRQLAKRARDAKGRRIISEAALLDLLEENRVRLLLQHGVPFSLECMSCHGCASGDGVDSLEKAVDLGWKNITPAGPDNPLSHFEGLCPEHVKNPDAEI